MLFIFVVVVFLTFFFFFFFNQIGNLPKLRSLTIVDSLVGGWLPSEIGSLISTTSLQLRDSPHLTGTLPTELGDLNLTSFVLDDVNFNGTLPTELGNLGRVTSLDLSRLDRLSGTLPTELAQLPLAYFECYYSARLSGSIPRELLTNDHPLRRLRSVSQASA